MDQAEPLGQHQCVIVHGEAGVAQFCAHLSAVPEAFVPGPPLRDGVITFTFIENVLQVHIGKSDHPHLCQLDRRDAPTLRIHNRLSLSDGWQWLILALVGKHQGRGRSLGTGQNRGYQLIPQRPWEREFGLWKII
jgi:hypothetical protein